ncbi:protein EFR3 homolog cmp44E-like [Planococcus citri]|uniref:protein EFR3 homolog cmp44E-like n=1 Tax=Planococcus citri TaxID=170843 RepID=UPI0031F8861D
MFCFNCCSQVTPRYKRLVDNIYPPTPEEGLDKGEMEKLMFYALSSPEKLDRIGEYFCIRVSKDIARKRDLHVKIAMEAMDQLLMACHSQRINLFVESFLRMVQKLMECPEPESQILATQSFVRFAHIEEDTPSYHRRYDFFVSKFSSMCHNNSHNLEIRNKIRLAGIKGLQGVIRKTVSDDLVENIWEPVHMDKIIPSLLYNMQNPNFKVNDKSYPDLKLTDIFTRNENEEKNPTALAETCFRELIGKASFGHVKSIIRPVLRHFDLHNLWISKSFAIHCFRLIMFSIQSQYLYIVVESLMVHLDENSKIPPKIRTNVADVLSKIIAIAASESVGPTVIEIINSLLTHLRTSVTRQGIYSYPVNEAVEEEENQYQEALIAALGEFAAHLPEYQKTEIMMFIMSKITHSKPVSDTSNVHNRIQYIYLNSLLMVCSKYDSTQGTLSQSFLDPLMRCSRDEDPEIRTRVKKILRTLFDKDHIDDENFKKTDILAAQVTVDEPTQGKHNILLVYGHNWTENVPSANEVDFSIEGYSNSSSPGVQRKHPPEDLSFEAMKRVSTENFDKYFEEQVDRNEEILEKYRSLSFTELVKISTSDENDTIAFKLNEIFSKMNNNITYRKSYVEFNDAYKPGLETLFPECFVY